MRSASGRELVVLTAVDRVLGDWGVFAVPSPALLVAPRAAALSRSGQGMFCRSRTPLAQVDRATAHLRRPAVGSCPFATVAHAPLPASLSF